MGLKAGQEESHVLFTGIVETMGQVAALIDELPGKRITIDASAVAENAALGDSICVNGCCLTVVQRQDTRLDFQAGDETLLRTNLGDLCAGDYVNLERSLRADSRLGGHYVTGHIDGLGTVRERNDNGDWSEFWFAASKAMTLQMASKGSVAVDGVSLTLVDVQDDGFSVALIPHTLEVTTLGGRHVGDTVNLETDVLAKYVQRQVDAWRPVPS